ncbi:MAG: VOC family protein [Candidatus Kariarchaeaceae archaeon]|jgi:catechol 2,3-dioxygenase-like lactoylglutathione lyase family enzyme
MKFGHIELFVKDPRVSKKFFCDVLGFELVAEQGKETIWVKIGETEFLIRQGQRVQIPIYQETNSGIVFYTDNLERSKSYLEQRGLEFKGIDGSEKCLTFQDPDGHWFQLVNPHDH